MRNFQLRISTFQHKMSDKHEIYHKVLLLIEFYVKTLLQNSPNNIYTYVNTEKYIR